MDIGDGAPPAVVSAFCLVRLALLTSGMNL